jgi:hypothetical protein
VGSLTIVMANTELRGLRLPAGTDKNVSLVWYARNTPGPVYLDECRLPVGLAQVVVDLWDNADGCGWLARQLVRKLVEERPPQRPGEKIERILAAQAVTAQEIVDNVDGSPYDFRGCPLPEELIAALHLVSRRNHLRAAPAGA